MINNIYKPYRDQVEGIIHDFVMADRRVLHVAVHTFTPELDGIERDADIGLLYDPKRKPEAEFARKWKKLLLEQDESLLVRFNYPYLGISDGFPTYLRRKFKDEQYMGIEIEVNQKFILDKQQGWEQLQQTIKSSLQQLVHPHRGYGAKEEAA
ncbi:N-formylglutamate amidohydrolase [Pontibacter rugosus]